MSSRRPAFLALSLFAAACGNREADLPAVNTVLADAAAAPPKAEAGAPGADAAPGTIPPVPVSGGLPCEVAKVLAAKCQTCHKQPPIFGAPMPLLSFADTQASAPSGMGMVWESMKSKIAKGLMPPPTTPTGPLTDAEKATLTAWLNAGAPAATDACTPPPDAGAPTGGPPTGVGALPCKPKHEFRAHGAADTDPFPVPVEANAYRCFTFAVPFTAGEQAVAWAPIIDDARVIHHWILYGHTNTTKPTGCGDTGRVFLMGWAPGGHNGELPPDVGLELPNPGTWLTLEVHYNNGAKIPNAVDRSGVAVCTTDVPRPQEAGVVTLGSISIAIPPDNMEHTVMSEFPGTITRLLPEPLHVLWTSPHMHVAGTSFKTEIVRGTQTIPLVDVPKWDFNSQRAYLTDPAKTLIMPGDMMRTVCTYKNGTGGPIRFGEKTENEMCFNFIAVYPITKVSLRQWIR
jgi:hypothetical protein